MKKHILQGIDFLKAISLIYSKNFIKALLLSVATYCCFLLTACYFMLNKELYNPDISMLANLGNTIVQYIIPTVALVIITVASPLIIYKTAIQYALKKVVHFLINDSRHNYLNKIVDKTLEVYVSNTPNFIKNSVNYAKDLVPVISDNKPYFKNKVLHKITKVVVKNTVNKKMQTTVDIYTTHESLKEYILNQIIAISAVNFNLIYILFISQIILLLYIYFI